MEHIIGHRAAQWAKAKSIATPSEFVAQCDDPKMLLEVLARMVASGAIDAAALKQARDIVGCGYRGDLPEIRHLDDEASNRLEKMLHDSRARYAKHVTAERCNLIRAAVPMLAESIASAGSVGVVMVRARKIATALYGECSFTVTTDDPASTEAPLVTLRLDAGKTVAVYQNQTEAGAWAECLESLADVAERTARNNRTESERLANKAADIAAAIAGADSR